MNHNFRILIVNSHNTVIGGNDMAALSQLKLLQAKGVPVALFSKEDVAKPFSPTRKQDFIKYFYSKSAGRSFTKVIEQFKPDIIHIHSFSGYLSNSLITMLQRVKVPAVFTVHDYRILCPFSILFQQGKVCMQCPQSGSTLGVVRNRCNRNSVVLSGVNYLDHLIAFKWLNFVDVIHRFHFVSAFSHRTHCHFQPRLETKSEYFPNFCFDVGWQGVKPHKGYILYLGRLAIGKGLVRFLEAYIKL
ncbi:MAG TPA: hypothetical protein PKD90_14165, partial [Phnomibacter sp.]|nr:hypothetical protein [Phnomibacter sp.]